MANRKRKMEIKHRVFHESWENEYFFIQYRCLPLCLLCNTQLANMKKYNLSRHYKTLHAEMYDAYGAERRAEIMTNLKDQHGLQEEEKEEKEEKVQTFQQQSLAASYAVALEIARSKMCFSDGDFIKKCAIEMAKAFENETAAASFKTVSLSRQTMSTRVRKINDHISDKLKTLLENCRYFSLCLGERTDVTKISYLSIFVRSIDDEFSVSEELLAVVPLRGTMQGIDIFTAFRKTVEEYGGFAKCSAIVTSDAKAIVGEEKGLRGLLQENGITCPVFQCIMYKVALCGKIITLNSSMDIVTRIVNLIRGGNRAVSHKKFKSFLQDVNDAYSDVLSYDEVYWLTSGKTLEQFFALRKEIPQFLKSDIKVETDIVEKFEDIEFLCELAFLTDITYHLNCLNIKLQKENQTIADLIAHIIEFRNQLRLFSNELDTKELYHFPACYEIAEEYEDANFSSLVTILIELEMEFDTRLADFDILNEDLTIFNNAKGCKIEEQKMEYHLELRNLQADPFVLSRQEYGQDLFKILSAERYPKLVDFGLKISSMFGSMYKCESIFSAMKYIKSKYNTKLTDNTLTSLLRITTTRIPVDIQTLVNEVAGPQCSH